MHPNGNVQDMNPTKDMNQGENVKGMKDTNQGGNVQGMNPTKDKHPNGNVQGMTCLNPTKDTIPIRNMHPKHPNIHTEKRKYRGTNILLYFIFSIFMLSMCISSSLIIKPGIEINYDSVDPYSYNDRVETVLSNLPSSVISELSEECVEINIVSGVGFKRDDINEYVYQRIPGRSAGTSTPMSPFSTSTSMSPCSTSTPSTPMSPCTPSVPQESEGYIFGCYVCNTQQIYIFIDNIENSGYEYQSLEGTLVHEIGHFLWHHKLTPEERLGLVLCYISTEFTNFKEFTGNHNKMHTSREYFSEYLKYYMDPVYQETIDHWGTPCTQRIVEGILT